MIRKKIENAVGFEKDQYSKAVVNTDSNALNAYKIQRERMLKVKNMSGEVDTLKHEVAEIKTMLSAILQKLNN